MCPRKYTVASARIEKKSGKIEISWGGVKVIYHWNNDIWVSLHPISKYLFNFLFSPFFQQWHAATVHERLGFYAEIQITFGTVWSIRWWLIAGCPRRSEPPFPPRLTVHQKNTSRREFWTELGVQKYWSGIRYNYNSYKTVFL